MTASTVINNVVIRPAASDDFEWVADLMVRALSPFYDGDHRAHAQRIFGFNSPYAIGSLRPLAQNRST